MRPPPASVKGHGLHAWCEGGLGRRGLLTTSGNTGVAGNENDDLLDLEFLQHWQSIAVVSVAIAVYVESLKNIENISSYGWNYMYMYIILRDFMYFFV